MFTFLYQVLSFFLFFSQKTKLQMQSLSVQHDNKRKQLMMEIKFDAVEDIINYPNTKSATRLANNGG